MCMWLVTSSVWAFEAVMRTVAGAVWAILASVSAMKALYELSKPLSGLLQAL